MNESNKHEVEQKKLCIRVRAAAYVHVKYKTQQDWFAVRCQDTGSSWQGLDGNCWLEGSMWKAPGGW